LNKIDVCVLNVQFFINIYYLLWCFYFRNHLVSTHPLVGPDKDKKLLFWLLDFIFYLLTLKTLSYSLASLVIYFILSIATG